MAREPQTVARARPAQQEEQEEQARQGMKNKREVKPVDWDALKPFLPKTSIVLQAPPPEWTDYQIAIPRKRKEARHG